VQHVLACLCQMLGRCDSLNCEHSGVVCITKRCDSYDCLSRKLLQLASTVVILNVWTDARGANFSPSAYWDGVFSSGCLDAIGPSDDRWTGDFLNATTLLRSANGTTVATVFDPPAASRRALPIMPPLADEQFKEAQRLVPVIRHSWDQDHSGPAQHGH
jgi:hypothetical protein